MLKSLALVVAVLIMMSNARRQQNLRDSGTRRVSDRIRTGRTGEDMVRRIRGS